ncbi:MAG: DUF1631 domain-containing protein [Limnobacter sp.]|nr:DUF1631 domain-containing protein [Limnobacter sp.]
MTDTDSSRRGGLPNPILFARARVALGAAATRAVREALSAIAGDLERAAADVAVQDDRRVLGQAASQLRREAIGRAGRVSDALSQRALRSLELGRSGPEVERPPELLDEDDHEAQIAEAALARAIRERVGSRYESYAARVRRLVAGRWQDDDFNPLGARTLAGAAVAAMAGIADVARIRASLRAAVLRHLAAPLAGALASVDAMLEAAGASAAPVEEAFPVEQPAVPPAVLPAEPPVASAFLADVPAETDATAGRVRAALDVDAATLASSPLAGVRERPSGEELIALRPVAELERDAVALAHAAGAAPYSREARRAFFTRARAGLADKNASAAQLAVLDVVAAMFDYVIDERRMPEAAKPLVWRLQQPAIALALLDPAYLGDEPRSLRRLIEHVGAIAVAFAEDLAHGSELHRRIEAVVHAVEAVSSALQLRSTVIARQVEREYARAAEHVEQLIRNVALERHSLEAAPNRRNRRDYSRRPSAERERVVSERIRKLIEQRLGQAEVPDSVRQFLLDVWLRHLRTAALRNGEDSTEFRVAMEVVDDLVWSLDGVGNGDRRELAERIPPLIRLMMQGVREIGAQDDEYRAFFDELFLIHLRRMQRRKRAERRRERERGTDVRSEAGTGDADIADDAGEGTGPSRATRDDPGLATQPLEHAAADAAASATIAEPKSGRPSAPAGSAPDAKGRSDSTAADPTAADRAPAARPPAADTERRVLEVLESLDLRDLADPPRRLRLAPEVAWARLGRGAWVELVGPDDRSSVLKVAWINQRRSVALLVRRSDRRAVSMAMKDLKSRFERGRAWLLASSRRS